MRYFTAAKKYGTKVLVAAGSTMASAAAMADGGATDAASTLTGVSTTGIVAGVVAILLVGIGVSLVMKGQSLSKKSINRI